MLLKEHCIVFDSRPGLPWEIIEINPLEAQYTVVDLLGLTERAAGWVLGGLDCPDCPGYRGPEIKKKFKP